MTADADENGLAECAREGCGHLRYHHRPRCTHIDGVFSYMNGVMCSCLAFEHSGGDTRV